ncbi:MAG: hypothetical protein JXB13_13835 [Phycisphaerae bacterium]|nr:hypothetical protein [Phycisphaerae bacterium]
MKHNARRWRSIRRASQRRSQHPDGLGVSELFLATPDEAATILQVRDNRLRMYLLGFTQILRRGPMSAQPA